MVAWSRLTFLLKMEPRHCPATAAGLSCSSEELLSVLLDDEEVTLSDGDQTITHAVNPQSLTKTSEYELGKAQEGAEATGSGEAPPVKKAKKTLTIPEWAIGETDPTMVRIERQWDSLNLGGIDPVSQ